MIFLNVIAGIQAIFLVLALLRFGSGKKANKILIFLLLTIALSLFTDSLLATAPFIKWPQLGMLLLPWDLVIGPLLLFYFQEVLQRKSRSVFRIFHLTPAFILAILGGLLAVLIPTDLWRTLTAEEINEPAQFELALLIVQCHVAVYLILCAREWTNYQDCTRSFFSSVEGIELSWLRRILWVFGAMWLVWLLTNIFAKNLPAQNLLNFAFPFGVYFLAYSALIYRNVILPEQMPLVDAAREQHNTGKSAYQRAQLTANRQFELQQSLSNVMERELPYLDPALNLAGLASAIGATSHELSQLLNEILNESFYDYINRRRIHEVQRCLKGSAYASQTILDIAMQSGFNSKAAFNAAFKRFSGCTPSQFRKKFLEKFK